MGAPITRSFSPQTRRRFLWITPRVLLWILGGIGVVCLLASGWRGPVGSPSSLLPSVPSPVLSSLPPPLSATATRSSQGAGAGGQATVSNQPAIALDICLPGDTDCFMHAIAKSMAQQMSNAAEPVVKGILNNPVDLFFQTPAALTYQNGAVIAIWKALMAVVAIALACLIVLGGYNVVIAPYFGLPQSSIGAFLPRLLLAFGAAHFSLDLLGSFIELENALCKVVIQTASLTTLTNVLIGFYNPANLGNLFLFLLILIMLVLLICLLGQMIVRIGMVALLVALAGPALICLALPQTQRYGRLWLTLFSSSVLVQFFQVTVLALGGMLLTAASATALWHLPDGIGPALLCTGMLFLALKIPGMLNHWALSPMQAMSGGMSAGGGIEAAQSYLQDQAARQASIDALATLI